MAKRRRKRGGPGGVLRLRLGRSLRPAAALAVALVALAGAYMVWIKGETPQLAGLFDGIGPRVAEAAGLTVDDVTVTGRNLTSAHEILNALGVQRGDAITSLDIEAARERLVDLVWVRAASVTRYYPGTIHVAVEEHEPLAIWQHNGRTVIVDDRGSVIPSLDIRSFPQLPLVVGAGAAEAAPEFLAILARRPAIAARVHSALRVGARRWSLRLDDGVLVHLPDEGVELALDHLVGLDERTGLLRRDIMLVDLRVPDRVTVVPAKHEEDDSSTSAGAGKRRGANT